MKEDNYQNLHVCIKIKIKIKVISKENPHVQGFADSFWHIITSFVNRAINFVP